jgi:large conductance mechanosensitive channel
MGGFRKFLLRGNIIDLAVAVVMGVAFNAIVQALVNDMITPLIAVLMDNQAKSPISAPSASATSAATGTNTPIAVKGASGLAFHVRDTTFTYGAVISAAISFLVIAAVVYWLIVAPAARLTALANRNKEQTERPCPECLSLIPVAAKRCMYCTSEVAPAPSPGATPQRRPRHGFLPADLLPPVQRFKRQPDESTEA